MDIFMTIIIVILSLLSILVTFLFIALMGSLSAWINEHRIFMANKNANNDLANNETKKSDKKDIDKK